MDVRAKPTANIFHMYRALVGVGMASALLIVSAFQLTKPIIDQKRAEALERAIFEVVPGAKRSQAFLAGDGAFTAVESGVKGDKVFAAYDDAGALVGFAIPAAGMGYADTIEVLYGYSPSKHAVVGMVVLASKETPGLGDKISKDPNFTKNFEALDARASGGSIENPIVAVKHGEKTQPWQIDGITGATISSKAIASILRESTAKWVPRLDEDLGAFAAPKEVTP